MNIRIAFTSLFTAPALVGASLTSVTAANAAESSAAVSASKATANEIATEAIPGTNTVVTDADSRSVSITLPGVISSSDQPVPDNTPSGIFAGKGEPVLSTSKIQKLIARFGSIQRTFEAFFRAWNSASSWERKRNALVKVGGTLALEIVGINRIKAACFDS
ncbi:MAG: hypothetical protein B5766_02135 [Candidatus Lumbricidophila eiseniae]|uniref:Uncharacterized protein n=1 Tax=Candidatus Lumbricidiphila eiseniae TaxID=1969409 RepID=A0A2A6FTJ2_9MICO|nr:MAG: hypothetical protein B5766_02135 [Candidatus Lumbricidophila eiseniae]